MKFRETYEITTELRHNQFLRPHVLVAGFGAFPGAPCNPSQQLVERIDAVAEEVGVAAAGVVLPVEWDGAWPALEAAIRRERPTAVLLVGLHARSERFRIERLAFNERAAERVDAAGKTPAQPRSSDGPARLESRLPMAEIAADLLRQGIDFEFSDDAGRYLCNDTLYRLASRAGVLGVERYGFVHTPLTRELSAGGDAPPGGRLVPAEDLERLVRTVLSCLADDFRSIKRS